MERILKVKIWWKTCKSIIYCYFFLNSSDYRNIPDLDRYDHADLADEEEEEEMDYQTRMAAEQEMEKRDRIYGARRWNRVDEDEGRINYSF